MASSCQCLYSVQGELTFKTGTGNVVKGAVVGNTVKREKFENNYGGEKCGKNMLCTRGCCSAQGVCGGNHSRRDNKFCTKLRDGGSSTSYFVGSRNGLYDGK